MRKLSHGGHLCTYLFALPNAARSSFILAILRSSNAHDLLLMKGV